MSSPLLSLSNSIKSNSINLVNSSFLWVNTFSSLSLLFNSYIFLKSKKLIDNRLSIHVLTTLKNNSWSSLLKLLDWQMVNKFCNWSLFKIHINWYNDCKLFWFCFWDNSSNKNLENCWSIVVIFGKLIKISLYNCKTTFIISLLVGLIMDLKNGFQVLIDVKYLIAPSPLSLSTSLLIVEFIKKLQIFEKINSINCLTLPCCCCCGGGCWINKSINNKHAKKSKFDEIIFFSNNPILLINSSIEQFIIISIISESFKFNSLFLSWLVVVVVEKFKLLIKPKSSRVWSSIFNWFLTNNNNDSLDSPINIKYLKNLNNQLIYLTSSSSLSSTLNDSFLLRINLNCSIKATLNILVSWYCEWLKSRYL